MNDVVWTATALANLRAIRSYLEEFNPRAAADVAEELITRGNTLVGFPYRGRPVSGNGLRELVTAYPYIIRYRITGGTVFILRIRHTARRPTVP